MHYNQFILSLLLAPCITHASCTPPEPSSKTQAIHLSSIKKVWHLPRQNAYQGLMPDGIITAERTKSGGFHAMVRFSRPRADVGNSVSLGKPEKCFNYMAKLYDKQQQVTQAATEGKINTIPS